jgi:2-dehydro-3-deoxyphosphooctonate aldolase (KDO 8-P synthase)
VVLYFQKKRGTFNALEEVLKTATRYRSAMTQHESLKANTRVVAGAVSFSNDAPISVLAGPCQMESREHALEMASALKEICGRLGLGLVYKSSFDKANRTSLSGKRGIGLDGALPVFAEIREKLGLPVVTDVHEIEHCAAVAPVVDILQIPAFLCRQTDLLIAAAKTGRVVKIKKGQFLAPWDMRNAVQKVLASGNANVMLTERGASFGYNTLVADMRSLPIMAETGNSQAAKAQVRAAIAGLCRCWHALRLPWASPGSSSRPIRTPTARPQTAPTWCRSRRLKA